MNASKRKCRLIHQVVSLCKGCNVVLLLFSIVIIHKMYSRVLYN